MIVLKSKSFAKIRLSTLKRAILVNKRATGFPNRELNKKGYRAAKEAYKTTGNEINTVLGKDGSFFNTRFYPTMGRKGNPQNFKSKNPKVIQGEFPGFRRGEVRGPIESDPLKSISEKPKIFRKPKNPRIRSQYQHKQVPGQSILMKESYTNGSARLKYMYPTGNPGITTGTPTP